MACDGRISDHCHGQTMRRFRACTRGAPLASLCTCAGLSRSQEALGASRGSSRRLRQTSSCRTGTGRPSSCGRRRKRRWRCSRCKACGPPLTIRATTGGNGAMDVGASQEQEGGARSEAWQWSWDRGRSATLCRSWSLTGHFGGGGVLPLQRALRTSYIRNDLRHFSHTSCGI